MGAGEYEVCIWIDEKQISDRKFFNKERVKWKFEAKAKVDTKRKMEIHVYASGFTLYI